MRLLAFLGLLFIGFCTAANLPYKSVYVSSQGVLSVADGKDTVNAAAWGYYIDNVATTGWGNLTVITNPKLPISDAQRMVAAGYLEGYLTAERISQNYINFYWQSMAKHANVTYPGRIIINNGPNKLYNPLPAVLVQWLTTQYQWLNAQMTNPPANQRDYWTNMQLVMMHFNGLVQGQNSIAMASNNQILAVSGLEFLFLNSNGDLDDLVPALVDHPNFSQMPEHKLRAYLDDRGHCSVAVKVLGNFSDVFMGHTTWSSYTTMLRMGKTYNFALPNTPSAKSNIVWYSGYPGVVTSVDDYYLTDQQLYVTETTNSALTMNIFKQLTTNSALSWQRAAVANRMATTSKEWIDLFSLYNSGTYNNQWMIFDAKMFTPGVALPAGTFWICETIPGKVYSADVTHILNLGYWPSYNRPFFPEVYQAMGYPEFYAQHGNYYSYSACPRANIFRREQGNVQTLDDYKQLQMFNKFQTDPYSFGNPEYAIAARYDLKANMDGRTPFGGIDSKVTSATTIKKEQLESQIICGPTHYNQAVFSWNDPFWANRIHLGMPEVFNFDWIDVVGRLN